MLALVVPLSAFAADPGADLAARAAFGAFAAGLDALDPPMEPFDFSYEANFQSIPAPEVLQQRSALWTRTRDQLRAVARADLSPDVRYQYDTLAWEVNFGLRRLRLERKTGPDAAVPGGLHGVPHARAWYRLYLQQWGSKALAPRQLLALGDAEVARTTAEIERLQVALGYEGRDAEFGAALADPRFWQTDESALQASLGAVRDTVQAHLAADFLPEDVPEVQIAPWEGATKDTPPGYWGDGVFHYSFFGGRFPTRATEWLYLHEAVPGHHYQVSVAAGSAAHTALLDRFWYPGFAEGWGAYVEDLGKDLGCYQDPWMELGKWEWDRVRSARVVLDVRIHRQGWTREQALAWWHAHLPDQDAIAEREVDRVIRWPAQVVSYKVGEHEILTLRAYAEARQGAAFDLRAFHALVLARGSIPLDVLDEVIRDAVGAPRRIRATTRG